MLLDQPRLCDEHDCVGYANFAFKLLTFSFPAAVSLGSELGNLQLALLFTFYTLTALFASNIIVSCTGYKWGIVLGLFLYVLYVASFIVADKAPSIKWPAACTGGVLGGVAAGILWSAQGSAHPLTWHRSVSTALVPGRSILCPKCGQICSSQRPY